jgi:cation diffusion facilitator CzcD-associated flavoprotein CzcO
MCDIPSPLYSFSFAQKSDWSTLFASQAEILTYLHDVAGRRGLIDRIRFGAKVEHAEWEPAQARWTVTTAAGERYHARFPVSAAGSLHHPVYPGLTWHNPKSLVLVEGPEITIQPVGLRRLTSGSAQVDRQGDNA